MRDTPKKPPHRVIKFLDSQAAIDGLLEDWLPRLIESNEVLTHALVRVRDYYLPGALLVSTDQALAEVKAALARAAMAEKGLRPESQQH
jgi:hypothetical protein